MDRVQERAGVFLFEHRQLDLLGPLRRVEDETCMLGGIHCGPSDVWVKSEPWPIGAIKELPGTEFLNFSVKCQKDSYQFDVHPFLYAFWCP